MKQIIIISTIAFFASCGQVSENKTLKETSSTAQAEQIDSLPIDVALTFINSYVDNCNSMEASMGIVEWVNSNNLTTNNFKAALKLRIEKRGIADRERGLPADPLFDAQDYPDKGFEIESFDNKSNYVVVKGIDWPEFKVTLKMVLENNNWRVDGCGSVNIP